MEPLTGMDLVISNIGKLVTAAVTWISSTVGVITASGNELILVSALMGFVGIGIGLLRRVFRLHV